MGAEYVVPAALGRLGPPDGAAVLAGARPLHIGLVIPFICHKQSRCIVSGDCHRSCTASW